MPTYRRETSATWWPAPKPRTIAAPASRGSRLSAKRRASARGSRREQTARSVGPWSLTKAGAPAGVANARSDGEGAAAAMARTAEGLVRESAARFRFRIDWSGGNSCMGPPPCGGASVPRCAGECGDGVVTAWSRRPGPRWGSRPRERTGGPDRSPLVSRTRRLPATAHRCAGACLPGSETQWPPLQTRRTSSTEVAPERTLRTPSSRRLTMPRSMHMRRNSETLGLRAMASRRPSSTTRSS